MQIGSSAYQQALLGIERGFNRLEKAASDIASADADPTALTGPVLDLIAGQQQVEASVKALETINETLGTLIDVKA
ncbi:MAG: hypothetical protein QNJ40_15940 [Xanthomonadales bacterium]|nr:hypothetical protein [Xanthomonadales bacterium]